ncbi:MAG TPA: hypothetical protein VGM56_28000 [Byssovorax sp.]|jgi:hypothetical protein
MCTRSPGATRRHRATTFFAPRTAFDSPPACAPGGVVTRGSSDDDRVIDGCGVIRGSSLDERVIDGGGGERGGSVRGRAAGGRRDDGKRLSPSPELTRRR